MSAPVSSKFDSYNDIPYETYPYSKSHPNHLEAIAKLFGANPANVSAARILELGCANGANIIPIALSFPKAEIVGIDISKNQIQAAKKQAADLQIDNITFKQMAFTDIDQSLGEFDYIIAHNLISFVNQQSREQIFAICNKLLSLNGIAYISYHTLPGWHDVKGIYDMLGYHGSHFDDLGERFNQSKLFLEFMQDVAKEQKGHHFDLIKLEANIIANQPESYFTHNYMSQEVKAYYFYEFMNQASKNNLQYLADVNLASMYLGNMAPKIAEKFAQITDIVRCEQYMDFVNHRKFRASMLCHKNVSLKRSLDASSLKDLYFSINLTPEVSFDDHLDLNNSAETLRFFINRNKDIHISSSSPIVKAIFYSFAAFGNKFYKIDQIVKAVHQKLPNIDKIQIKQEFVSSALKLIFAGYMEISAHSMPDRKFNQTPKIYKLAQYQAENSSNMWLTNTHHIPVAVNLVEKLIFKYMNGKNSEQKIVDLVFDDHIKNDQISINKDGKKLDNPEEIKSELTIAVHNAINSAASKSLLV